MRCRETRGKTAGAPIMRDLIANNGGNVRGALMAMEMELMLRDDSSVEVMAA